MKDLTDDKVACARCRRLNTDLLASREEVKEIGEEADKTAKLLLDEMATTLTLSTRVKGLEAFLGTDFDEFMNKHEDDFYGRDTYDCLNWMWNQALTKGESAEEVCVISEADYTLEGCTVWKTTCGNTTEKRIPNQQYCPYCGKQIKEEV